jgi:GDP-D-mannose 3',5'-epimerase
MSSEKILVGGAGGFIGGHLVKALVSRGHQVRAVDYKPLEMWYQPNPNAENIVGNLEDKKVCYDSAKGMDLVYNLACNMGGMGFIENNKALCMLSVLINTHMMMAARDQGVKKYLYSSSACVYNGSKQTDTAVTALKEEDAYPAMPEDGYGWEKLFSERMCRHFHEDTARTCASCASTMFTVLTAPIRAVGKRLQRPSAARSSLRNLKVRTKWKSGAMGIKPAASCMSMIA